MTEKENTVEGFDPNRKKILDNKPFSGIMVPIAIVLVGCLLIFGVTKMLSSGKTYRDLVIEMQSKTFGNRWVAAYELSKLVVSDSIPAEEIPWFVDNLAVIYDNTIDHRTRNFIIITFGALKHPKVLPYLEKALNDPDKNVSFNAIVAAGNLPDGLSINWAKVMEKLDSEDPGIRHAAILTLANKRVQSAQKLLEQRLQDKNASVRYAAATGLVHYKSEAALDTINEILNLNENGIFNPVQLQKLKLNLLSTIGRERWTRFEDDIKKIIEDTDDLKIETTARQALILLKN